jgi:beta-glucosidase
VRAYVEGFQHGTRGASRDGVLAIVKHWVGYGAAVDGFDGHNHYGRYARLDATTLDLHAQPFVPAFRAGVAGVMPTYSILQDATWGGQAVEQVGAGFNRFLLTDMLRGRYGFRGLIVSDWAITNDCGPLCLNGVPAGERPSFAHVAMPWGVESLPTRQRFVKAVLAGIDQFGGVESSELLVDAVKRGELTEARLSESAVRVMEQKFQLGLFENPFVDAAAAPRIAGSSAFRARALDAQRASVVLLENRKALLPARRARRVYLHGIDSAAATARGWTVVADPAQAELAIMRLSAPFETLHPGYVFGAMQHEGSLAFRDGDPDLDAFTRVSAVVPTVVSIYLDRPAILTPIRDRAAAVLVNFGISDEALFDVIVGRGAPRGRLPFDLPSSMATVAAQRPDRPFDSASPLYRFGYGLRY